MSSAEKPNEVSRRVVASPKTPILTRVALTDCWSAGWLLLRAAEPWPQMALDLLSEVGDDIVGKRRWIGRRRAMRLLAEVLHECGCTDLAAAAQLMATDPSNAEACREIAQMLAAELKRHNIGDIVAPVISGWSALAHGWSVDEKDPIKAARAAYEGEREYRLSGGKAESFPPGAPAPEELAESAVLDDWETIPILGSAGRRCARGLVSGSKKAGDGARIVTSAVVAEDVGLRWIRTRNSIYKLGCKKHEMQPIVRAATASKRAIAYKLVYGITGQHTLPAEVVDAAIMADDMQNLDLPSRLGAAKTVGDALAQAGRKLIARAWLMLAADATNPDSCAAPYMFLAEAAGENPAAEVRSAVLGWKMLARGKTWIGDASDAIAAARLIGEGPSDHEDDEPGPEPIHGPRKDGVVVLPNVGGLSSGSHAKEVHAEFKEFVGKRIPLVAVPDVEEVRAELVAEFPHAVTLIDIVLADLVGRQHVKFAPTLLVGPPGCGKTRLARKIGETCGLYVGAFDGAGAGDAAFGGTGRRWSTGEPCWPMIVIKAAGHANPLIVVDEIDKAGTSRHNGNLVSSILPMLEIETAKRFADPYIQAQVDVSHVSYVLTCNDDKDLPRPLKDRCRPLHMPPIKAEHVPAIAAGIVRDIAKERGLDPRWLKPLDGDEIEIAQRMLGDGSIRRLRILIEKLLALRDTSALRN